MWMTEKQKLQNFIFLYCGQLISQFGTSMTGFAVVIWAFSEKGSVIASSSLAICTMLPYLVVGWFGGSVTDKVKKKKIMLASDLVAAIGTLTILYFYQQVHLEIWILCLINFVNGTMNAFQKPAAKVVTSLLIPKKDYVKIEGIQSTGNSMMNIFTPVIAASMFGFGGLELILAIDFATFLFAFITLIIFVKIPETIPEEKSSIPDLLRATKEGIQYLVSERGIFTLFLLYASLNFFASLSFDSMVNPYLLARTGNNSMVVGIVSAAAAASGVAAGVIISTMKSVKRKVPMMFAGILLAFCGIASFGMGRNLIWWIISVVVGCFGMPFYFSYESAIIRENVPMAYQGRVFAMKDTLTQPLVMLGYWLGALLADYAFEPFMQRQGTFQSILGQIVGRGPGAGMGLIFVLAGLAGLLLTLRARHNKTILALDSNKSETNAT